MTAPDPGPANPDHFTCPNCGGNDLFVTEKAISSGGGYAPNLLPGLGRLFATARLHAVLCADCGLHRQFADATARERVRSSGKWRRL